MAAETAPALNGPYEPRHPTLTALGFFAIWIAILSLPMLSGKWLAGPYSDQFPTGYATRTWAAEEIRRTGALPAWDPHMFGGIPFVAGQHGDIFYLTSALRVVLPTSTAMNLGFVIHYLLAGLFTYLLLRRLKVSWTGALVGGLAYQLSGLIASYPSPGHDGKLFVSTWFPLALLALVMAIRERRWEGYGLLAFCVGVSLLSPHYQMTYYLLIASGLFALYLAFGEPGAEPVGPRIGRLGLALGAVLVGFGIAMIQIMPFFEYLPYSPRAESYGDFARSASYAIPWNHVPELFLSEFVGRGETYWGSNPLKYHSEYLGLPVVALAVLGMAGSPRRRLTWWLGGIGLLFLLISLGGSTPFYRLWWSVMPYVKQTRAPGMAFFVVAFVMAVFAAAGVERLERGEGKSAARIWLAIGAAVGLIALVGGWGGLAESLARAGEPDPMGRPLSSIAAGAGPAIRWGAFGSGAALAVVAGLALAWGRRRLVAPVFAGALALAVGADLWLNARHYWMYSENHKVLFRPDPVTDYIRAAPPPYRALDVNVYPEQGSALMAFDIPTVLGYHGFEPHRYDELLGGRQVWRNFARPELWDLLAVRFVITPRAEGGTVPTLPGYRRVLESQPTSAGVPADLYERVEPVRYARVVPAALKAPEAQIVPTLLSPRMDFDRVVLLDEDAPVPGDSITSLPPPSPSQATVTHWEPGRMAIALDPAPPADSYVLVAENWWLDWRATVDGREAAVLRGDNTLITVPVPAGARQVELVVKSRMVARGGVVSLLSLVLVLGLVAGPAVGRWRRRG